jgi:hypothetical protein
MEHDLRSVRGLRAALEGLGFRRARRGRGYRHNGLAVTWDHRWLTFETKAEPGADPLWAPIGQPGLWKPAVPPKPKRPRRELHLPLAVLSAGEPWADDGEEAADPLRACLDWAAATAKGALPKGWKSPPRDLVESWIPRGGLVVRSGPLLRQGELRYGPERLGLRFPLAGELSEQISLVRRDWLGQVLADAGNRWRMVRVGFCGQAERPAARAEVDFSGAPAAVLEGLFRAGLDAIRWVVSWSLWSVGFLGDARVACRCWEAPRAGTARRKEVQSS